MWEVLKLYLDELARQRRRRLCFCSLEGTNRVNQNNENSWKFGLRSFWNSSEFGSIVLIWEYSSSDKNQSWKHLINRCNSLCWWLASKQNLHYYGYRMVWRFFFSSPNIQLYRSIVQSNQFTQLCQVNFKCLKLSTFKKCLSLRY